ncbi:uncharacterized protein CPUR_06065 [Claviceps purpurea 20.1]|uniref:Uncharacterized protein n=1 Tax=Claviceps purpurea (strain 20.1) TaxID=1111077 RepID=M1W906_CLAP2|nr:uncharacterized protein CPUR_06065 [Claviceps purpurea 20.1]
MSILSSACLCDSEVWMFVSPAFHQLLLVAVKPVPLPTTRCAFELFFSAPTAVEIAVNIAIKITVVCLLAQQATDRAIDIFIL